MHLHYAKYQYVDGGFPEMRLKTLLNANTSGKPVVSAISVML